MTLLDVGHPLVRRLLEEVKQRALATDAYGRTAYVVTPDIGEVTALFHLLARYVVGTQPTSIIEALVPVAVAIYSEVPTILDEQTAAQLAAATCWRSRFSTRRELPGMRLRL